MNKQRVLILCTGNSCRSHMAEGILRTLAGDLFDVYSAGSKPAGYVHPKAIEVMAEIHIDISNHLSQSMDLFIDQSIDIVITVCDNAQKACPVFTSSTQKHHWSFLDPAHTKGTDEEITAVFRAVRDQIKKVFMAYVDSYRDSLEPSNASNV